MMEAHWKGGAPNTRRTEDAPELLEWKARFLSLPEIARLDRVSRPEGEISFAAKVGGRPLRGVLDLFARTERGFFLVDYKTDRASSEEILARYRVSLGLYRMAVRVLAREARPVEAAIYAARNGVLLPISDGEAEAADALARYDRAEAEGDFPGTRNDSCTFCPYRRGCPAFDA
jgi:hypothetical protein